MASFLSVSKYYLELRNHVSWNKGITHVTEKIFELPYYNQFTSIYLNIASCVKPPKNVQSVTISSKFDSFQIKAFGDHHLPCLTDLVLLEKLDLMLLNYLFTIKTLKSVSIGELFGGVSHRNIRWPENIETLQFGNILGLDADRLPNNVKKIVVHSCFVINSLPSTLEDLSITQSITYNPLPGVLPPSLKKLYYASPASLQIEKDVLPEGLEELSLVGEYDQPIFFQTIPKTVKKITFGHKFDHLLDALPDSVEYITLGIGYTQSLENQVLPKEIKEIYHQGQLVIYHYKPFFYKEDLNPKEDPTSTWGYYSQQYNGVIRSSFF